MRKIIKTLLLVMVVVLALTVFVACEKEEPEVPTCAHQGGKATCTEAPVCELCGESYGEALGHKGGTSTCTKLGICATCGEEYGELKAHTPEYFADEYFCDKEGLSAGSSCSVCGTVIRKRFPLKPTGHNMTEGSCTEDAVCLNGCGYVEAAPGHAWTDVEGLEATCTDAGYTAHKVCDACGEKEGYEELPAGHVVDAEGVCTGCGNVLVTTGDELIAALGAGKNALLMNDIVMDATLKCPYGNSVGVAQKGGVLDGNGHTLTVNGSGNYYAIITYGGTIKNLTINSGFRAIVLYTPTEDVIIDNVTIYGDDIVYGLNTAEYPTLEGIDIVVKNSTICGWVSFAGDYASVSFDNCDFIQGVAYDNAIGRLVRPYLSTTFTNCTFVKNAYLDLSALGSGETVTLVGCTVDGVEVTVDAFTTTENDAEIPFTYEAPAGVEMAPVAVEGGVSFHRHGYVANETAPTCTAAGKIVYTCACGDTYTEAGAAATGHTDADGNFKCDVCSATALPASGSTITVAQAIAIGNLFEHNAYSTQKYYITGIVASVPAATYGNFDLTDGNGNTILIYGLYSADGKTQYGSMADKPKKGDEITVYTVLGKYSNAPQGKNAWMDDLVKHTEHVWVDASCTAPKTCSLCDLTEGEMLEHTYVNGECTGCGKVEGAAALVNANLSFSNKNNRTQFTTSVQVWEQNGVKVTNNKASSSNNVADYASPARFYAGSNLVVEGVGISKIVFDCNSSSYATALKNSIGTVSGATVTVSSDKVTVTFSAPVDSFTIAKLTAQVRMDSITIN